MGVATNPVFSLQILRAQLADASGQYNQAISLLHVLNSNQIQDTGRKRQILETLASSQIALGQKTDAVATLLNISAITTNEEQLESQRRILSLLQSMDPLHLSLLRENNTNPALDGWLTLTDTLANTTPANRQADLQNWHLVYL